jgi:hypothetical protein
MTNTPPARKGQSSDTGNAGHFATVARPDSDVALALPFDLERDDAVMFSHANGDFATGHDGFIDGVTVVAHEDGSLSAHSRFGIELTAYLREDALEENRDAVLAWFESEHGAVIDTENGWADADARYPLDVDAGSTADSLLADAKLDARARHLHHLMTADKATLKAEGLGPLGVTLGLTDLGYTREDIAELDRVRTAYDTEPQHRY